MAKQVIRDSISVSYDASLTGVFYVSNVAPIFIVTDIFQGRNDILLKNIIAVEVYVTEANNLAINDFQFNVTLIGATPYRNIPVLLTANDRQKKISDIIDCPIKLNETGFYYFITGNLLQTNPPLSAMNLTIILTID
jgi:hypothetical protein